MSDLSDHETVYDVGGEYKTKEQIRQDYAAVRGSLAEQAVEEMKAAPVAAYDVFRCECCKRTVGGEEHGGAPWFNHCKRCRFVETDGGGGPQESTNEQEAAEGDTGV